MHRASPTLLALVAVLAGSVVMSPASRADEPPSPVPGPVLLTPSPRPSSPPLPAPSATDSATPTIPPARPSASPGEPTATTEAAPAAPVPRTRLPLKQGHLGPKVARAQQHLTWLGYAIDGRNLDKASFGKSTAAAVRAFQVKNWLPATGKVDERTWRLLRKHAEPVGVLPLRCTEVKRSLCIDKTTRTLRLVVKGKVVVTTDARFGAPGMETGEGLFTVKEKSYNHTSSRYGSWMPRAMFFNGDEAVHYSPDFAAVGYARGSHGCIGVRDLDIATELFEKVDIGTRVYVYWS